MDIANTFIVFLLVSSAWMGTAALVQKRTLQRRKASHRGDDAS